MSIKFKAIAAAAFGVLALSTGIAQASPILTLDALFTRISDTQAELSFSGFIGSSRESFLIKDVLVGGSGAVNVVGDLMLGSSAFNYALALDTNLLMDFDGFQDAGAQVTGSAVLTLTTGVWASVGTFGTVAAGTEEGVAGIVGASAVPLPAALPMIGAALAALGLAGRRRRHA